jgi:hypothetical protein
MKMKLHQIALVFLIIIPNVFACTSSTNGTPEMPDIGIPLDQFNTQFKIVAPDGWNTFKVGDGVTLDIEVIGDNPIAFKADYGAALFVLKEDHWVEVANMMKYPKGYFFLEPARGEAFKTGAASVDPILNDIHEAITLRVILIGNIVKDKQITDERVAGYIDVELKP